MRTRLLPVIGVVLALGFSSNSSMQSGVGIPRALMDRGASTGSAPVIVGVRTPSVAIGDLRDVSAIESQREKVHRALDDVTARAEAKGVAIGRRFESIPFFTARVTADELTAIAQMPEITSIQEDVPDHVQLIDSVSLVSAPAAWAAGSNGAGWTVAVLDTGVDKDAPVPRRQGDGRSLLLECRRHGRRHITLPRRRHELHGSRQRREL